MLPKLSVYITHPTWLTLKCAMAGEPTHKNIRVDLIQDHIRQQDTGQRIMLFLELSRGNF
jgi:hypothetical protein